MKSKAKVCDVCGHTLFEDFSGQMLFIGYKCDVCGKCVCSKCGKRSKDGVLCPDHVKHAEYQLSESH
jgi:hypothetical protein